MTAKHEGADAWKELLIVTDKGAPKPLLANAITALREASAWQCVLSFDAFASETKVEAPPPWMTETEFRRPWSPQDDILTANWLQHQGIAVNVATAAQAVETVARDRSFHPVMDYLDSLEHDGMPRLDGWLSDFLGVERSAYSETVGRSMLIAAVARIHQPGCKVDTVPILEGGQGVGKSTSARVMFDPWFSDELADLGSKDAVMQTRGVWGIEVSELDAMSRMEVSKIKAFISRTTDRFRPPYGARVIESPRTCVFWGTTNADDYLKDETGGRRFWPIKVGRIDIEGLRGARDQLWAEACRKYQAGVAWWIVNPNVQRHAEQQQRNRYVDDPWNPAIDRYVEAEGGEVELEKVLLYGIGLDIKQCGQLEQNRAARVLKSLGLVRRQRGTGAKKRWVYSQPGAVDMPATKNGEGTSSRVVPLHGVVPPETAAAQAQAPRTHKAPVF